eukprot:GHVN01023146.1.p1 GENE.GHVN01023146.1~~GHVN01023146.1.p1  ORF type:complete len:498 (+),score=32.01 GHVN01023146.1:112-1605(+)
MQVAFVVLLLFLSLLKPCASLRKGGGSRKGNEGDFTTEFRPQTHTEQSHEIENVLEQLETHIKEKASKAITFNNTAEIDEAMAEWMSVRHQRDLLRTLDPDKNAQLFAELGMTQDQIQGMREGILDSDKGKIRAYKKLLTQFSVRSEKLYDALRLRVNGTVNASVIHELRTIVDKMGFVGRSIFNSKTTNSEFRELMQENPGAQNYLHEMPGLIDAVELRENGIISAERFSERVKANFFHNGPDAGFWVKLKGFVFHDNVTANKMLGNTIFLAPCGHIEYPESKSVAGLLHRMADRLSQGTRGGMVKLVYETRHVLTGNRALAEMSLLNPLNTVQQLHLAHEETSLALDDGSLGSKQAGILHTQISKVIGRIEHHHKLMWSRILNAQEIFDSLSDPKDVPERLVILEDAVQTRTIIRHETKGHIYVREEILRSLANCSEILSQKLFHQLTNRNLIDIGLEAFDRAAASVEDNTGDPMRPLSERDMKTKKSERRNLIR